MDLHWLLNFWIHFSCVYLYNVAPNEFHYDKITEILREEEYSHIALLGDRDFDDPPVEVPLLQLRPQPQPQLQSQSSWYSDIITLIKIIELIGLIAVVFFLLSDYFSPKPAPTRTGPPPLTPAGR
ncbi:hypothetical protein BHYA_0262g00030 [Botrytis hyacinthi]|uniref:Uncharacterized protein n=1 Tax=Botrytis hyacinthi TaxID=278943 RepID=A0A4Z1G8A1_9HELO|nr:hypothetical protein BHYA_0262g00030 [Botrytis hyacinthi]